MEKIEGTAVQSPASVRGRLSIPEVYGVILKRGCIHGNRGVGQHFQNGGFHTVEIHVD